MKYIITLSLILLSVNFTRSKPVTKSSNDFETDLNYIINHFKENIKDKDECEKAKRDCEDLVDEMKDAVDNPDTNNSQEENEKIKSLYKQTEAVSDFIGLVGGTADYFMNTIDFYSANQVMNASVFYLYQNIFCENIIEVKNGDYFCIMAENTQDENYTISYSWKQKNQMTDRGSGKMGNWSKSVRPM